LHCHFISFDESIPLPDPTLLEIHAIIARTLLHAAGKGLRIEQAALRRFGVDGFSEDNLRFAAKDFQEDIPNWPVGFLEGWCVHRDASTVALSDNDLRLPANQWPPSPKTNSADSVIKVSSSGFMDLYYAKVIKVLTLEVETFAIAARVGNTTRLGDSDKKRLAGSDCAVFVSPPGSMKNGETLGAIERFVQGLLGRRAKSILWSGSSHLVSYTETVSAIRQQDWGYTSTVQGYYFREKPKGGGAVGHRELYSTLLREELEISTPGI
jgi:hypothetical protein